MKIRRQSGERFWHREILLIIMSTMLINVKLFTVAGAAFKLIHIVMIGGIITAFRCRMINLSYLKWGCVYLVLPLLPLYRINDLMEWIKSYFVWVIMIVAFVFCYPYWVSAFKRNVKQFVKFFLMIVLVVQILGIVQFVLMNFFGIHFLENIFGSFQFQNNLYGIKDGLLRAYSLYYEPSVLGWVSAAGATVLLMHDSKQIKHYWIYLTIGFLAVLMTISASGLLVYLAVVVCKVLLSARGPILKISVVLALVMVAVLLWNYTSILTPLERITNEYGVKNTSGYERMNTPLMYVERVLQHYPVFGRGLGQEGTVDQIGRIGLYETVNNALLGIIVQFGISSIVIYAPIVAFFYRKIRKNAKWWLPTTCLVGIYASTGAYVSLDTFLFVVILLLAGECLCEKEYCAERRAEDVSVA